MNQPVCHFVALKWELAAANGTQSQEPRLVRLLPSQHVTRQVMILRSRCGVTQTPALPAMMTRKVAAAMEALSLIHPMVQILMPSFSKFLCITICTSLCMYDNFNMIHLTSK